MKPETRRNIKLTKLVLDGKTFREAGEMCGVNEGRAWQIAQANFSRVLFDHERLYKNGKQKNLAGLRLAWQRGCAVANCKF